MREAATKLRRRREEVDLKAGERDLPSPGWARMEGARKTARGVSDFRLGSLRRYADRLFDCQVRRLLCESQAQQLRNARPPLNIGGDSHGYSSLSLFSMVGYASISRDGVYTQNEEAGSIPTNLLLLRWM